MADHEVEVELFYDGQWNAAPAYSRNGIALSRGAAGEGQDAPPSSASLTLAGSDHNPRNVTGPLYGAVGRNTPMRVSADGSVRSTTEAASWKPGRAVKGDAWTAVEGGGILRRLQQGKTPLRSPAVRAVPSASNLLAFWPLEDGQNATFAASGLPGGDPMELTGSLGFGQGVGLPGSPSILDTNQGGGSLRAPIRGATAGAFGIEFVVRYPTGNDAVVAPVLMDFIFSGGTAAHMYIYADPYLYALPYTTSDASFGAAARPEIPVYDSVYRHFQLDIEQVGSDVRLTWYVNGVFISTGSFPGQEVYFGQTLGTPVEVRINPAGNTEGMPALGYLALYDALTPGWVGGIPYLGYPGERAGRRFLRLMSEEDISADVIGNANDTQPMGPQPADTILNIVRECVRTDDGMLFEPVDDLKLIMRTGRSRYNQDAALTLDFAGEQLAPGLVPVLDDQGTRNDVTATRRGGSSARYTKTSGPLNASNPIDDPEGVGRYDVGVDVNPASDDRLLAYASWHVAKGTVDEPRYPNLTIDLDAPGVTPALLAAVNALPIGDRVEVENLPVDWQYGNAALLLLGVKESFPPNGGDYRRLVTLNTGPASVFEIGIVGANDGSTNLRGQAVDTDNSTLNTALTLPTTTTLSVASTGGTLWTTNSADWNPALNGTCEWGGGLFIIVGGEVMRVTNITGASSPQTFTVVRSVNGVFKTHSSGTPVHVAYPVRVGL